MMKSIYQNGLLIALASVIMISCNSGTTTDSIVEEGNWVKKSSIPGSARHGAVAFVIGDLAYIGLGRVENEYLTDFYSYDAAENGWSDNITSFPGTGRNQAVSFAINGKGYVGTGFDGERLNDFWEFDPKKTTGDSIGSWRRVADFIGSARFTATGFSLANLGFVGLGNDKSSLKDFYSFDPSNGELGTWTKMQSPVDFKGDHRQSAVSFTIDDKVYVTTGISNNQHVDDLLAFYATSTEPSTWGWIDTLSAIDSDTDYAIARSNAVAFENNGKGYITTGKVGTFTNRTWEYDPSTDLWSEKSAFEGNAREGAIAFTVGEQSFVGLGTQGASSFTDIYEFIPDAVLDTED